MEVRKRLKFRETVLTRWGLNPDSEVRELGIELNPDSEVENKGLI
jgi:hypothetical protein